MEEENQEKKSSVLPKIAAGIGIAAAGAFIAKKLLGRGDGNDAQENREVNPVLQDVSERRGMQLFIKSDA
jgi:hypothetical protein